MTDTIVPVKGLVWKHAKRTERDYAAGTDVPATFTVTQVNRKRGIVHSHGSNGSYSRIKTPLGKFSNYVKEVVSVPSGDVAAGPKFTDAQCEALWVKAHEAGMAAGEAAVPVPMHVVQRANPFDDSSPVVKRYAPVMDGPCGFAWITVRPGTSSFARWARKHKGARAAYHGGTQIKWVGAFNQSLERKAAYASAFAEVLREAGIKAYGQSRMD